MDAYEASALWLWMVSTTASSATVDTAKNPSEDGNNAAIPANVDWASDDGRVETNLGIERNKEPLSSNFVLESSSLWYHFGGPSEV